MLAPTCWHFVYNVTSSRRSTSQRASESIFVTRTTVQIKTEKISELTINRLSIYLRCLNALAEEGTETVSSQILAERFSLNSAQIRKDLAYFGEFGVRGVGYYVDDLRRHIRAILGLDSPHRLVVIGAGNLGMALANYDGFHGENF